MAQVSIIVPVYNSEKYIKQCVDSLRTQTFGDLEILLIDDGSTDQSGNICDLIASEDKRVIVHHQDNMGASQARKKGVELASGQYISFVDSDDYVESDFCEELVYTMKNQDADLVECGYNLCSEYGVSKHNVWPKPMVCDSTTFLNTVVQRTIINGTEAVVLWNKLFKKNKIIELVKDWGQSLLEDYLFLVQYYKCVDKYVYIDKPLLNYRQVAGSLSRRINKNILRILENVEVHKQRLIANSAFEDLGNTLDSSNRWFVQYLFNYLKNYYAVTKHNEIDGDFIRSVITSESLYEKCHEIKCKNRFHRQIENCEFDEALSQIRKDARKERIRRKLHNAKNSVMRGLIASKNN